MYTLFFVKCLKVFPSVLSLPHLSSLGFLESLNHSGKTHDFICKQQVIMSNGQMKIIHN